MTNLTVGDLRGEISGLGTMLGDTIREIAGEDAFELVERVRRVASERRSGQPDATGTLVDLFASCDDR